MQKKKRSNLEYRIFLLSSFTESTKKRATLVRLETVKEFANFSYEIVVDEKIEGRTIAWDIHGLRSPEINLPASGPATFTKKYENLEGVYEFVIRKLDRTENAFSINILKNGITVSKPPRRRFVEIFTNVDEIADVTPNS